MIIRFMCPYCGETLHEFETLAAVEFAGECWWHLYKCHRTGKIFSLSQSVIEEVSRNSFFLRSFSHAGSRQLQKLLSLNVL